MHQIGNQLGVVDKRQALTEIGPSPSTSDSLATNANYSDDAALDARLTAAAAASYPASVLKLMTSNDKVFAVRNIDDSAGIK